MKLLAYRKTSYGNEHIYLHDDYYREMIGNLLKQKTLTSWHIEALGELGIEIIVYGSKEICDYFKEKKV